MIYYQLLKSDSSLTFEKTLEAINRIEGSEEKQSLIIKLALDQVDIDPEQAARMAFLIEDVNIKEETIVDIIARAIQKDLAVALKLSYLIEDLKLKVKVLFGIIAKYHEKKKTPELVELIYQIVNLLGNSDLSASRSPLL